MASREAYRARDVLAGDIGLTAFGLRDAGGD
jgi:hypothetical protein